MEVFDLVLFGFIIYAAIIVVPSIWDDVSASSGKS